jgi:hypothetical protein
MAGNKTKTDRLHDQLNPFFNTRNNPNWSGLISAIGEQDQFVADLIVSVAEQFFVKTANRPYLDRLGANVLVNRPKFIGMDDTTFRNYIPVLAYQPKQVKHIIDTLLDIFFFKQSTTAHVQSTAEPFALVDGWELQYTIDGFKTDTVQFKAADFVDITNATAEEVAAAINRQANDSFAIAFNNPVTKQVVVQLFTNTIGAKGSVTVTGGRADIAFQFEGFLTNAANSSNVQWTVTKVGDLMTFQYTAGSSPNLFAVQTGDTFISNIHNNVGSFIIESVNLSNNSFTFRNLFGTPGVYTQTSALQSKFINNYRSVVWTNNPSRAVTWEVSPGEFTVEMPTSPPVVRRSLAGSAHINGQEQAMTNRVSDTRLTIADITNWPSSGTFELQGQYEIQMYIDAEATVNKLVEQTRLQNINQRYTYSSISGNDLVGISPALPQAASLNQFAISAASRDAFNNLTIVTSTPNTYSVGESAIISGTGSIDGTWPITQIVDPSTFIAFSAGPMTSLGAGGTVRVERAGLSNSGSLVLLEDAVSSSLTGVKGPYVWDLNAAFVLSSLTGDLTQIIHAGQSLKIINIGANNLDASGGQLIFDFGTSFQEGPVRYLFKPSANTIAVDPAYVFENDHAPGSAVTAIRTKGPHAMSGTGTEFAPYVTDPTVARTILEGLILDVKSAGIFVEFLIRYPEQLYGTLDVYNQQGLPVTGEPFGS